jgi:hypothetical protein
MDNIAGMVPAAAADGNAWVKFNDERLQKIAGEIVTSDDPIMTLLYLLMRDHLTPGKVATLVDAATYPAARGDTNTFSNTFLAGYARFLAEQLCSYPERASSEEWQQRFPDVVVMDPDGWDRSNFDASWAEPITLGEYRRRLALSTCGPRAVAKPRSERRRSTTKRSKRRRS